MNEADLPGDWKLSPAPSSTKDFGSALLLAAAESGIVVIPDEFNYLLNPLHVDSKKLQILNIKDFVYDIRIKRV